MSQEEQSTTNSVGALEQTLLEGDERYTSGEISALAGVSLETAKRLWRCLGFSEPADDQQVFAQSDVQALNIVKNILDATPLDLETVVQFGRVIGSSTSRIAEAEVAQIQERIRMWNEQLGESVTPILIEQVSDIIEYTWRRHLLAVTQRSAAMRGEHMAGHVQLHQSIGFADMVGFTTFGQKRSLDELSTLLERFEAQAYSAVTAHHGRIIKMIGDEVMYVADNEMDAVRIGIELSAAHAEDGAFPPLKIGIASGRVLTRGGDYFGPPVNLASRIAGHIQALEIVVSASVYEACVTDGALTWRPYREVSLKDIGIVPLWMATRK